MCSIWNIKNIRIAFFELFHRLSTADSFRLMFTEGQGRDDQEFLHKVKSAIRAKGCMRWVRHPHHIHPVTEA